MPRKTGVTQNFNPPADATMSEVLAALEANTAALQRDVVGAMDKVNITAKQTLLGHEAYVWGEEILERDIERGGL